MLTPNEILSMTNSVVETMRKTKFKDKVIPEYHNTYVHSVEMKEAISVHSEPGKKPEKLLAERAPNQTDQEYKYAVNNYQQTTIAVFLDTVHTMQRAFSDNNWSIDYRQGDDQANELQQYLEWGIRNTPLKLSFDDYYFQVVPSLKLHDAMGVNAYKPYFIPTVENGEELVIDSERLFEPIPVYYSCEAIMAYQDNKWFLFLTEEKSWVEWGNGRVQEGLVFEYYDEQFIYRITQVGKKIDYKFEIEVYFQHDLGWCPVDRLKGIPASYMGEIIFQSLFLYAVPFLNDVILDSTMLRCIKATSVFPYRVMTGNICTNTMELNGEIQNCEGTGWFRDLTSNTSICCPVCMGSGQTNRISPSGVLLLRPETAFKEGELKASQPAMYYVEPSTATPTFLRSEIEKNTDKARQILHLRTSDSQVKGQENLTATGMVLDEKALYSTVKMFSDQVFDSYEFGIRTIGTMRYGTAFEMPVVTRSITFDFATEYEYMEKISLAIKNGLPSFVVYEIVYRYIKTMFYNEVERAGVFDLLVTTDRLLVTPYEQINLELAKGIVAPWEVVLHDSGITLIKNLMLSNPTFLEQEIQAQKDQLIAEAQRVANENKTTLPTSATSVVDAVVAASNAV